jgi:AcrR family transcriptional regulator
MQVQNKTQTSSKDRILQAAANVVQSNGAAHLTIDAVAAEAGLSKGGVLYHYPNKRAMIKGMVQLVINKTTDRAESYRSTQDDDLNITIRSLMFALQESDKSERAMSLAILAAAAEDPSLLDPARDTFSSWYKRIQSEGEVGVLLLFAIEGLRFIDMLNLLPLKTRELSSIHQLFSKVAEAKL